MVTEEQRAQRTASDAPPPDPKAQRAAGTATAGLTDPGRAASTEVALPGPGTEVVSEVAGAGLYRDVRALSDAFQVAAQRFNFLSPVSRIDYIPPLHAVSMRIVKVNPVKDAGDVYGVEGGLALHKSTLDRIAQAAGISWDPRHHGRVDDASEPYYVRFRAVGHVIDFDGRERIIVRERAVDLREGSAASATTSERPPTRLCPARRPDATTSRLSGSWSANARRFRSILKTMRARTTNGTAKPSKPRMPETNVARSQITKRVRTNVPTSS